LYLSRKRGTGPPGRRRAAFVVLDRQDTHRHDEPAGFSRNQRLCIIAPSWTCQQRRPWRKGQDLQGLTTGDIFRVLGSIRGCMLMSFGRTQLAKCSRLQMAFQSRMGWSLIVTMLWHRRKYSRYRLPQSFQTTRQVAGDVSKLRTSHNAVEDGLIPCCIGAEPGEHKCLYELIIVYPKIQEYTIGKQNLACE